MLCTYAVMNSSLNKRVNKDKHVEYLFQSIIRTGYTTHYMIASYFISLSLSFLIAYSLLSLCVCVRVNVVQSNNNIKKKKKNNERRIFKNLLAIVRESVSFNNRKKKTRRQRTNETGLSFGMQHNKIEEGQRRRISMLQHLMMSKRVDGFCTPFNIEEEEEKSPFYFEKRRARS